MPAGNTRQELQDYADTLDQVYELTIKYAPISTVLWLGDLNGSFDRRTPVGRDKLLRQFVNEAGFIVLDDTTQHTFHHHSLQSTSRLDYILQLKDQPYIVKNTRILAREDTNLSPHDPVLADMVIQTSNDSREQGCHNNRAPLKVRWNTMNTAKYKDITNRWIQEMAIGLEHDGTQKQALVEDVIAQLQNNLYETAVSVAGVKRNSRGPPRRRVGWEPSLKLLLYVFIYALTQVTAFDDPFILQGTIIIFISYYMIMVFTNILTMHQNNFIHTKCVVLLRRGGIYIRRRRRIMLWVTSQLGHFTA